MMNAPSLPLGTALRARAPDRSPEPSRSGRGEWRGPFLVQQHALPRPHYGLRLEMDRDAGGPGPRLLPARMAGGDRAARPGAPHDPYRPARIARERDPLRPVLGPGIDLAATLERLEARVRRSGGAR